MHRRWRPARTTCLKPRHGYRPSPRQWPTAAWCWAAPRAAGASRSTSCCRPRRRAACWARRRGTAAGWCSGASVPVETPSCSSACACTFPPIRCTARSPAVRRVSCCHSCALRCSDCAGPAQAPPPRCRGLATCREHAELEGFFRSWRHPDAIDFQGAHRSLRWQAARRIFMRSHLDDRECDCCARMADAQRMCATGGRAQRLSRDATRLPLAACWRKPDIGCRVMTCAPIGKPGAPRTIATGERGFRLGRRRTRARAESEQSLPRLQPVPSLPARGACSPPWRRRGR